MRIEKRLRQEVEATDKKILEEGHHVKHLLMDEHCTASKPTSEVVAINRRNPVLISVCCLFVVLLVAGIVWFSLPKDQPVHYLRENEVTFDTTVEEIYNAADVRINENNFTVTFPQRVEDSVSGDILYYQISIESTLIFPYGLVYFVTNANYEFVDIEITYQNNCSWKEFSVSYAVVTKEIDGLPMVEVTGCVEYKQIRIYFSYTDIDFGDEVKPSEFLDSLIVE